MAGMLNLFKSVSPLDGRYKKYTFMIADYLSEYKYLSNRILVEVRWLQNLVELGVTPVAKLSKESLDFLESLPGLSEEQLVEISTIERRTMHDVQAIQEYIRSKIASDGTEELKKLTDMVHLLCTSEDINSPAHAIGIRDCMNHVVKPLMMDLIHILKNVALENADKPMLSRTHGQPAVPTTFGKEIANFVYRLSYQYKKYISNIDYFAKFGGAVGNFNAHVLFFPDLDWQAISRDFIEGFGLTYQPYSTQIECHDFISEVCDSVMRFNTILKDLCMDLWLYTSNGLMKLKNVEGEVGSSTMPHKINPIDLENAEGNLGVSNALLHFFSSKLPMSRMQRDLSDSSVLRTLGAGFGHAVVAYKSLMAALDRLGFDERSARREIDKHWIVLSEPVQVTMKLMGKPAPFEKVLGFTRGLNPSKEDMLKFVEENCGKTSKVLNLNLVEYTGLADKLAKNVVDYLPNSNVV